MTTKRPSLRLTLVLLLLGAASWSCLSVQDFKAPVGATPDAAAQEDAADDATTPDLGTTPDAGGPWAWEWMNPRPTSRTLVAVGGRSDTDVWVAGEGGTIAHFDGSKWDLVHAGPETTRYFAIGARGPKDVYVAGTDAGGKIVVTHYDGASWTESYSFAGSGFRTFSHGPGSRLFAITTSVIVELTAEGTWVPTYASAMGEHGLPVDIWVAPSGTAWALTGVGWNIDIDIAPTTIGAWPVRLDAGSRRWTMEAPPASVPKGSFGVALSGAGENPCAFYAGPGSGIGFLRRTSAGWTTGPVSEEAFDAAALGPSARSTRSACFADGRGLLVHGTTLIEASPGAAPQFPYLFEPPSLLGALSFDGETAYAVGGLGAVMKRSVTAKEWDDVSTTRRRDLLDVSVGSDGTVMVVDARSQDRSKGGEVVSWNGAALAPVVGKGVLGPKIPIGVSVFDAKDAWVVTSDFGGIGVARWTGSWSATQNLASGVEGLAIFAPAKNDIWITGRSACSDRFVDPINGCSKPQSGFAWHFDGATWKRLSTGSAYRAIHGSAPNDVWFVGDGVAHWDGKELRPVSSLKGAFRGVWSSAADRVWLWGDEAVLFDGKRRKTPLRTVLGASPDWSVQAVAESAQGDIFVLTAQSVGSALLWFDGKTKKLVEQITSDLSLSTLRGNDKQLWAVGAGGAALRFAPPTVR